MQIHHSWSVSFEKLCNPLIILHDFKEIHVFLVFVVKFIFIFSFLCLSSLQRLYKALVFSSTEENVGEEYVQMCSKYAFGTCFCD